MKFPVDAPRQRVLATPAKLGFAVVREGNHVALERRNADGTTTPHDHAKSRDHQGSTLRTICRQAGIARDAFLNAWEES